MPMPHEARTDRNDEEPRLRRVDAQRSLTQEVTEILRSAIARGELPPGSVHPLGALAQSLGVSRTPVREALIQLAAQGMVRIERSRGVRILQTSIHDLEELFELRALLEIPATRRAVAQVSAAALRKLRKIMADQSRAAATNDQRALWELDRAFHHTLLMESGNRRLADYVDSLRDILMVRISGSIDDRQRSGRRDVAAEHRRILECVENHDADGAAEAVRDHLRHTAEMLAKQEMDGDVTQWVKATIG
jgi:DNA-binding GntR family transcriptional regulator